MHQQKVASQHSVVNFVYRHSFIPQHYCALATFLFSLSGTQGKDRQQHLLKLTSSFQHPKDPFSMQDGAHQGVQGAPVQHCMMADLDEYYTSQKCSTTTCSGFCDQQLKKVTVKDGAGLSGGPREVKQCSSCLTVSPFHLLPSFSCTRIIGIAFLASAQAWW